MKVVFHDLEHGDNPQNGKALQSRAELAALFAELRAIRPPFMCEFAGDRGYTLTVGIAGDYGCIQHASNDGSPPYLMAVDMAAMGRAIEYVVGGTATPIDARYRVSSAAIEQVVAEFIATGERSAVVRWEEFTPEN